MENSKFKAIHLKSVLYHPSVVIGKNKITINVFGDSKKNIQLAKLIVAAQKLLKAAKKFIEKVETGKARSTETYNELKDILKELEK